MLSRTESKFKSPFAIVLIIPIFSILIIVIGVICIIFPVVGNMNEESLKSQGRIAVEATVVYSSVETRPSNKDDSSRCYYVSYYDVNDEIHFSILRGDQFFISEGDKFIAYYDPDNPDDIIRSIQFNSILFIAAFIIIAILCFASPIIVHKIKKKKSQMKNTTTNPREYHNPYNNNNTNKF